MNKHLSSIGKVNNAARELAKRMNAALHGIEDFATFAPIVIATARGCGGNAWQIYDDAGGNAHSWTAPEFHKVRQVRNSPTFGAALCDAVNEK
jgi:hypothetical protein